MSNRHPSRDEPATTRQGLTIAGSVRRFTRFHFGHLTSAIVSRYNRRQAQEILRRLQEGSLSYSELACELEQLVLSGYGREQYEQYCRQHGKKNPEPWPDPIPAGPPDPDVDEAGERCLAAPPKRYSSAKWLSEPAAVGGPFCHVRVNGGEPIAVPAADLPALQKLWQDEGQHVEIVP